MTSDVVVRRVMRAAERCVRVARARQRTERVVERDREARRLQHERAVLDV